MRAIFETGVDLGLVDRVRRCKGVKNRLDLNKKPIFFLVADFATEEICSFQDRSDATETPNKDRVSHNLRVFEPFILYYYRENGLIDFVETKFINQFY